MFEDKTTEEIVAMLDNDPQLKKVATAMLEMFQAFNILSAEAKGEVILFVEGKGWPELAEAFRSIAKDAGQWVIEKRKSCVAGMRVNLVDHIISIQYRNEEELETLLEKATPWTQEEALLQKVGIERENKKALPARQH